MNRARFLHLGLNWYGIPATSIVDTYLDIYAPDWLRYAPNAWLIWTTLTPQQLHEVLKPALESEQYLITAIDTSAGVQGLFTPFVWDWINRARDGGWTPPQPRPTLSPLARAIPPLGLLGPLPKKND